MCLHDWGPSDGPKWMAAEVEALDDPTGDHDGRGDWDGDGLSNED
jgi:hypothetical protein